MKLSSKQKAILVSLYRRFVETGIRNTFVPTKGVSTSTMKSLYKTGYIESDRAIKDVPINMRISDEGIKMMKEYFDTKKKSVDTIINRNKQFMRFVQNTDDKKAVLVAYLQESPMIKIDFDVTHKGYGIFEVTSPGREEQYYGVYNLTEGNLVEIGGCFIRDCGKQRYYIEKVKIL